MDRTSVLVLGADGFIGRHLIANLTSRGVPVVAATRDPAPPANGLVRNVVDRFCEASAFSGLLDTCAAVVHAASESTPGSSVATPQLDGNLRTTLALLEALQAYPDRRLVFLSSAGTLYGERETPARETDVLRPRSYHGAGKAAAEHFIHAWAAQHEGTAAILRPTNVYGRGQRAKRGFAIVPTAMDCAATGDALSVWGDGSQIRDYLHVRDLVELVLRATLDPMPAGCHVLNAASGDAVPLNDLLARIEAASNRKIARTYAPPRASDVAQIRVDACAARELFGWTPAVALDDGLADTWRWHQGQE